MSLEIYVDSDGVLADWVSKMIELVNHPEIVCQETLNKHPNRSEFIQNVYKKHPDVFAHLSPITTGMALVKQLQNVDIPFKILTAVGPDHHSFEIVKETKLQWFKLHLNISEEDVICVPLSADKQTYCKENAILIDDYEKNIEEWIESEGVGILFKDNKETIKDILTEISSRYKKHIKLAEITSMSITHG